ncbi:hypothetical protein OHA79_22785 [Streptomyces sp. NBC_00841]|uniref:hypothetical protein n=1 Tax=Streptomyces sp. NBC_00841 TaxID=2975847 RepID=UPI002DD96F10|nr:hypothetical protein [Streptomyces sp. NBC_00841]WSA00428.1 hypothetical protein OHA79_22785 [Streptomyces sp. NBC_00841]
MSTWPWWHELRPLPWGSEFPGGTSRRITATLDAARHPGDRPSQPVTLALWQATGR